MQSWFELHLRVSQMCPSNRQSERSCRPQCEGWSIDERSTSSPSERSQITDLVVAGCCPSDSNLVPSAITPSTLNSISPKAHMWLRGELSTFGAYALAQKLIDDGVVMVPPLIEVSERERFVLIDRRPGPPSPIPVDNASHYVARLLEGMLPRSLVRRRPQHPCLGTHSLV